MNKNEVMNRVKYILLFVATSLALECVSFILLGFGVFPKYILFDVAYWCIISAIMFLIDNRPAKIVIFSVLLFLQLVLNSINICYYKILGDIFSFDLLKLTNETAKVFRLSFLDIPSILINLFVFGIGLFLVIFLTRKDKVKLDKKTKMASFYILLSAFTILSSFGVGSQFIAVSALADCDTTDNYYIVKSDAYLYDNLQFKQESYKKFGTFGFYIKDILNYLTKTEKISEEEATELKQYIQDGRVQGVQNAPLKDKNLICIMLESFEWSAIDPYCTPTLYDLMVNHSQTFTNFRASNRTNDSERIAVLGNTIRSSDFITLAKNDDFIAPYSIPNLFRNNGYTANYFHSYDGNFYGRYYVNKKLGFENVYALQDANLGPMCEFGDFYLDEDYVKAMIDKIAPTDKKFYSYFTTVKTHGGYDSTKENLAPYYDIYDENVENIAKYFSEIGLILPDKSDTAYYNRVRQYKCSAMDTDRMVKFLIDHLKENNLYDNTTLFLFADHNCYYDNVGSYVRYGTEEYDAQNSDIYNIPFMIVDSTLGNATIDTFCDTYDIAPTICNLFGLDYNKNLQQGKDVYSADKAAVSVFVSNNTVIFNDKLFSYNIVDVHNANSYEIDDEYIEKFKLSAIAFYEKQDKIDKIYKSFLQY